MQIWFFGSQEKTDTLAKLCEMEYSQSINEVQVCLFPVLDYGTSLRKGSQEWHFLHLQRVHILQHSVSSLASVIPVTLWRPTPGTCALWDRSTLYLFSSATVYQQSWWREREIGLGLFPQWVLCFSESMSKQREEISETKPQHLLGI